MYLGLTAAIGVGALPSSSRVLGRGQAFRARKIVQIAIEGAAYAIAMGAATSGSSGRCSPARPARRRRRPLHGRRDVARRGLLRGARVSRPALRPRREGPRVALRRSGSASSARHRAVARRASSSCSAGPSRAPRSSAACTTSARWATPSTLRSFVARAVLGLALTLVYVTPRIRRRRLDARPLRRLGAGALKSAGQSSFLGPLVVSARPVLRIDAVVLFAVREGVVDEVLEPGAGVLVGGVLELVAHRRVVLELVLVPRHCRPRARG